MNINRIPLQGLIEITNACNFKCIHCYVTNCKEQKEMFLSYDVIKNVIDEVCEMGCKMISITGGECTLHPDFEKIYTYIWKKGLKVNIFTNASLITPSIISLFKKYQPNCVSISIYGASKSTYNEVTKSSVGYKNSIHGLELLQCNGINIEIKIIVLKQNEHELTEMKRLACNYTSNPIRISYDLMPSYDHSLDVLKNHSHFKSNSISKNDFPTSHQAFNCHAGTSFFSITYEGNVTLCSFCGFSAKSLKEYSFHDIWESFDEITNLSIPKDSQCYDCEFLNTCNNCPARTWMFNKKIGLYPIPQCKKIKKEDFPMKIKEILPSYFVTINGIVYFRLDNGKIAVERIDKVVIDAKIEDTVELITMDTDSSEKVNFWKINDNVYALASNAYDITLPKDTTFVDCYSSNNYPEGHYVKYKSSDSCGIIYVSETEVSNVISYENGYSEICFQNDVFYADAKNGENKFHVIGESGKLLGTFPSKCKRYGDYLLFYNENKIFIDSDEFEIPDGISSVEVINSEDSFTFIKVTNRKGVYLYNDRVEYLFGPVDCNELRVEKISICSCFIYALKKSKCINVSYVKFDETPVCKSISCKKGFKFYHDYGVNFFISDTTCYVFSNNKLDFFPLNIGENMKADTYKIHTSGTNKNNIFFTIVAFNNNEPIYYMEYTPNDERFPQCGYKLELITQGFDNKNYITRLCDKYNSILGISNEGKILFKTNGKNIYKKRANVAQLGFTNLYFIEESNSFNIFTEDGTPVYLWIKK